MDPMSKYLTLMQQRPELFHNTGEAGEIKILQDPERIRAEQQRIQAKLRSEGKPENWIDIGVIAEDEWEYVVRDLVEFPDGRFGGFRRNINRKYVEGGTGVVIMPVQGDKVLLLKHFRHESRDWHWEFPRGWGASDLTAEENANKELMEEVGLLSEKLVPVWRDSETVFFYAEMQAGEPHNQDGEAIQKIELLVIQELENWISDSKVTDWFTILTFLMAKNKGCFSL
jgi:ADP-ribose pyrophosphatase